MSKTYSEFVSLVRNWANRDEEVLSDSIVADCMKYAIAKADRVLRISEFETTTTITAATLSGNQVSYGGFTYTEVDVPADLLEYIQIRRVDITGGTVFVFNERTDIRTFHDLYAEKYSKRFWTRIGDKLLLATDFSATDTDSIELHYYGKEGDVTDDGVANWYRDTNEQVLLNGSLYEAFIYLNEPDTAGMYQQRFMSEMNELNSFENYKKSSGGNMQININGGGLI